MPLFLFLTIRLIVMMTVLVALCNPASTQQQWFAPPAELVRRAVQNESKTVSSPKYMFLQHKESPQGSEDKLMVETRDAIAGMVIATNGHPLSPEQLQGEYFREERFVQNPDELKKKQDQEKATAERIGRILKALPDAFLYEYEGDASGGAGVGKPGDDLLRLKFRPNPRYNPPSRVELVLTGMEGYMLINAHQDRLARIDGTLTKDVGFGWGFLGHLDHGGHFVVEQSEVDKGQWEITRMVLTFTGKILLVKSLNIKSTEVFSDFRPVPSDLTFAQGLELLKKQQAALAANRQGDQQHH